MSQKLSSKRNIPSCHSEIISFGFASVGEIGFQENIKPTRFISFVTGGTASFDSCQDPVCGQGLDARGLPSSPALLPFNSGRGNLAVEMKDLTWRPVLSGLVNCEKCEYSWPMIIGDSWR
jgi:hypothetical protein